MIEFILIVFMLLMIWIITVPLWYEDKPLEYMSYEEEIDWLINDHGLSYEEADEIASGPGRPPIK